MKYGRDFDSVLTELRLRPALILLQPLLRDLEPPRFTRVEIRTASCPAAREVRHHGPDVVEPVPRLRRPVEEDGVARGGRGDERAALGVAPASEVRRGGVLDGKVVCYLADDGWRAVGHLLGGLVAFVGFTADGEGADPAVRGGGNDEGEGEKNGGGGLHSEKKEMNRGRGRKESRGQ